MHTRWLDKKKVLRILFVFDIFCRQIKYIDWVSHLRFKDFSRLTWNDVMKMASSMFAKFFRDSCQNCWTSLSLSLSLGWVFYCSWMVGLFSSWIIPCHTRGSSTTRHTDMTTTSISLWMMMRMTLRIKIKINLFSLLLPLFQIRIISINTLLSGRRGQYMDRNQTKEETCHGETTRQDKMLTHMKRIK